MTSKTKLTKTTVDGAQIPASGEARIWDRDVKGFCLRVYSTGRKVYAVKYRVGTRQRWHTIGEHGKPYRTEAKGEPVTLTAELARREAEAVRGDAHQGKDTTQAKRDRRAAITVAALIDRYIKEGPRTKPEKRASSWAADEANLTHHVKPLIGGLLVHDVTRSDVASMVAGITAGETAKAAADAGRARVRGGAGIAERAKASASAMFSWGVEHGVGKENPAKLVRTPKRAGAGRFLSGEEAERLLRTLADLEEAASVSKGHGAIIRLLLLTGARKNEIVALDWSEVDLGRKSLLLPPERTKAGGKSGSRRIALSAPAIEILTALKGEGSPKGLVFPGARRAGATAGVQKAWEKVRAAAGLPGLRLHDLRHSFASFAVAEGASLFLVGKALGHADSRTTERYAHLTDDPLQQLAEAAGRRISGKS